MTEPNRSEETAPEAPELDGPGAVDGAGAVDGPGADVGPGGAEHNADEEGRGSAVGGAGYGVIGPEDVTDDPGVGEVV